MTNLRTKPIDSLKTLLSVGAFMTVELEMKLIKIIVHFQVELIKIISLPSGYNAKVVSSNSYLGLKNAQEMRAYQVMQVPFQY